MIITPHLCIHFDEKQFKDNLNKTCKLKGRCQLISDKASCRAYTYKSDVGFWDINKEYVEDIQEISLEE